MFTGPALPFIVYVEREYDSDCLLNNHYNKKKYYKQRICTDAYAEIVHLAVLFLFIFVQSVD